MISVVIPTWNAQASLIRTLEALVPATVQGLVREVIIADGGSEDQTCAIADEAGATVVTASRGRGQQLRAGARDCKGRWLLFLHADTLLAPGWEEEVETFITQAEKGCHAGHETVGVFRFALDDFSLRARFLEQMTRLRCLVFALPYGDQGLLISRDFYHALGGFRQIPLMEDVDMVRRITRRRLVFLKTRAITSPVRYVREGYGRRVLRNAGCLLLYVLRVSPFVIARLYNRA